MGHKATRPELRDRDLLELDKLHLVFVVKFELVAVQALSVAAVRNPDLEQGLPRGTTFLANAKFLIIPQAFVDIISVGCIGRTVNRDAVVVQPLLHAALGPRPKDLLLLFLDT